MQEEPRNGGKGRENCHGELRTLRHASLGKRASEHLHAPGAPGSNPTEQYSLASWSFWGQKKTKLDCFLSL